MSHVIVPEVTIDPTPLMLELCSEAFDLELLDLDLDSIESAAKMIKEACHASASAINTAKTNLLLAYMADPQCRRWMKAEFLDRVDCDNGLLTKAARLCSFRFYTAEKLVIEDLGNNGEFTPNESVAARTGVPEKTVERVKKKLEKKKVEAEEKRAQALQEALEADKSEEGDLPDVEMTPLNVNLDQHEEQNETSETQEEAESTNKQTADTVSEPESEPVRELVQPVKHDKQVGLEDEAVEVEIEITADSEVLSPRELAYQKEIDQLKLLIEEKDAEIVRLQGLVQL